ncbi:MAG: hypothetical protein AAGG00_15655 [Cyanobacteria bacterium P01_H01_bin.150]
MSQKPSNFGNALQETLGNCILAALTQQEISQLLDAAFATLSSEELEPILTQLPVNTQKTLQKILNQQQNINQEQPVSLDKLAQTWSQLWQEWNEITEEASQEDGRYIAQEVDWEPPYFDAYTMVEDLEKVAQNMQPLIETAFENQFIPDDSFAAILFEMESEIPNGIPDWMDIDDGIYLEENITNCFLQWEWLVAQSKRKNAFEFTQQVREWEEQFSLISLDDDAVVDFFTQLSETEQQCILAEFSANKEASLWKTTLDNTSSPWHHIYMHLINQYAPERYLVNMRATIPQQWQNGLPVIEDFLAQQDYSQSLSVIQETLNALLKSNQVGNSWTPETSLLFNIVSRIHYSNQNGENEKTLLHYYQQTARGLGESERANALEIQKIAFTHSYDWSTMFQAFTEVPVSENIQQALFQSWRDYIVRRAKPRSYYLEFQGTKTVDNWWLQWLIDSIADLQKGKTWFQEKITSWLTNLPLDKAELGEEYNLLRLLTKDLIEVRKQIQNLYPRFYRVVIQPQTLSSPDDESRQTYLQQYSPSDLWERILTYWREQLYQFIPQPELAQKSDYTQHAQWMTALKELNPNNYETLLQQWKINHRRRSNLWKAMREEGLELF